MVALRMASDLQCRGSYLTGSPGCCTMTFITGWCRGGASRNEAEWVTDAGLLLGEMDASDGGFGRPQWPCRAFWRTAPPSRRHRPRPPPFLLPCAQAGPASRVGSSPRPLARTVRLPRVLLINYLRLVFAFQKTQTKPGPIFFRF